MGVKARQAADLEVEPVRDQGPETLLVPARKMVVTDIGRVREDEIVAPLGSEAGEIGGDHSQTVACPEVSGGAGESWVELDAAGVDNRSRGEDLAECRIKRPGAQRGIEEANRIRSALPLEGGISCHVEGQRRRGRELAESITLRERLQAVQPLLFDQTVRLDLDDEHRSSRSGSVLQCLRIQPIRSDASLRGNSCL